MQETIYMLNSPVIGFIDTTLMKQDVTPFITPQLPASWNAPKTRWRIKLIGDFSLSDPGDLFFRKLWLGKTQLTFDSAQSILTNEGRTFHDVHDFMLYGDNLHALHSIHHTGLNPTSYTAVGDANTATVKANTNAVNAFVELSRNDAPLIKDDNWNNFSVSFYGSSAKKIGFSVREFIIEKIS